MYGDRRPSQRGDAQGEEVLFGQVTEMGEEEVARLHPLELETAVEDVEELLDEGGMAAWGLHF